MVSGGRDKGLMGTQEQGPGALECGPDLEVTGWEDGFRAAFLQDQFGKKQDKDRSVCISSIIYISFYLSG